MRNLEQVLYDGRGIAVRILPPPAGIAWAGGRRYYEVDLCGPGPPPEYFDAVGVPIEVQFTPVKGRAVGLGIVGYANINAEESFGGVPSV